MAFVRLYDRGVLAFRESRIREKAGGRRDFPAAFFRLASRIAKKRVFAMKMPPTAHFLHFTNRPEYAIMHTVQGKSRIGGLQEPVLSLLLEARKYNF